MADFLKLPADPNLKRAMPSAEGYRYGDLLIIASSETGLGYVTVVRPGGVPTQEECDVIWKRIFGDAEHNYLPATTPGTTAKMMGWHSAPPAPALVTCCCGRKLPSGEAHFCPHERANVPAQTCVPCRSRREHPES